MVKEITIGVLGLQGAVSEHIRAMQKVLVENDKPGKVKSIKYNNQLIKIDGLIIPGGESTTISKRLQNSKLLDTIFKLSQDDNMPIMGTCAGCVLLAKEISDTNNDIIPLKLINMEVTRNAYGRQKQSFEKNININGFFKPYNAVFIRAPIIEKIWGNCEILAKEGNNIAMVKQNNNIALTFHPELTDDYRVHKFFLDICLNEKK